MASIESIEIRKVANGFVMSVNTEEESKEYVYDTARKALRALKTYLDPKGRDAAE
jgi:hypothetical protein